MAMNLMSTLQAMRSGDLFAQADGSEAEARGVSDVSLAVVEANAEVAELEAMLSEADSDEGVQSFYLEQQLEVLDFLQAQAHEALQDGGMTPREFALAQQNLVLCGLSSEIEVPALQSFSGSNSRQTATHAVLHAVIDSVKSGAAKVKQVIIKIIDRITKVFAKLFTVGGKIGDKAAKLEKKAAKMGTEVKDKSAKMSVSADLLKDKSDDFSGAVEASKATVKILAEDLPKEQSAGEDLMKAIEKAIDDGLAGINTFATACTAFINVQSGAGFSATATDGAHYATNDGGLGGYGLALVVGEGERVELGDNKYIGESIVKASKTKRQYRRLVAKANLPVKAKEIAPFSKAQVENITGEIKDCSRVYLELRDKSKTLTRDMNTLVKALEKAGTEDDEKKLTDAIIKIANNAATNFLTGYMAAAVGCATRLNGVLNLCDKSISMTKSA